jgi:hypothetical protein
MTFLWWWQHLPSQIEMRICHRLSSGPMTNYQPSQFEMSNHHRLTSSLMTFSFRHSLKTSKQSKLSIKRSKLSVKKLLPTGDRTYLIKPRQITYHYTSSNHIKSLTTTVVAHACWNMISVLLVVAQQIVSKKKIFFATVRNRI